LEDLPRQRRSPGGLEQATATDFCLSKLLPALRLSLRSSAFGCFAWGCRPLGPQPAACWLGFRLGQPVGFSPLLLDQDAMAADGPAAFGSWGWEKAAAALHPVGWCPRAMAVFRPGRRLVRQLCRPRFAVGTVTGAGTLASPVGAA